MINFGGITMKRWILMIFAFALFLAGCQGNINHTAASEPNQAITAPSLAAQTPAATSITLPEATPTSVQSMPTAAPAGIAITKIDDMVGVWKLVHHPHFPQAYWLLSPDGKYKFASNPDGTGPSESGKDWFEDGIFMISDDFCPTPGKYTVQKIGEGDQSSLSLTMIEDNCAARQKILTAGTSTWVGPLP
jgi:hypothetical protein